MKKAILALALVLVFSSQALAAEKLDRLVLAGPKSSVTHPMAYIIEAGLLKNVAKKVELVIWDNPDQLRSLIAGGQAHFSAVPSYVAAEFYNKGVPVRLMNISAWGILWMVSSDPRVKALADLKGQRIAMAYRNDMPDLVFQSLVSKHGMDPAKDFKLNYKTNFPTVVQEVLSGRVKHALLAEPMASVSLMKSAQMQGKAPKLYRAVNIQEEWGRVYGVKPRIPQAGIAATPKITGRPDVMRALQKAYAQAIAWCNQNPKKAARMVCKYISGLKPGPVAAALQNAGINFVSAQDARPELERFYSVLKKLNPAKVGGKPPGADFYWSGK